MNLNLRFLIVAILSAYMGAIGGAVWQMERTHPKPMMDGTAWDEQLDKTWAAGYAWGLAECAGEDSE